MNGGPGHKDALEGERIRQAEAIDDTPEEMKGVKKFILRF